MLPSTYLCLKTLFSSAMCSTQLNSNNVPGVWKPSIWNLPFFHDLEWCSGQSWDWYSLRWSSVWSAAPYRVVQQYGTCLSWFLKNWGVSFHSSWPFGPAQLYGPLKQRRKNGTVYKLSLPHFTPIIGIVALQLAKEDQYIFYAIEAFWKMY